MLLYGKLYLYINASRFINQLNTPLQANFQTGISFSNLMEYTAHCDCIYKMILP